MKSLLKDAPVLSKEKQLLLLKQYVDGDNESGGRLVHSLAPFIWRVIQSIKAPAWIDREEVMADCLPCCYDVIKKYDPQRSSIQTFIYPVVQRRAWRSIGFQIKGAEAEILDCDLAIDGTDNNHNDLLQEVQGVLDRIPKDQMNERSRQVAVLLMRGRTSGQIASAMEWDRSFTSRFIHEVRIHLAWRMVQDGVSAEPFLKDSKLLDMAREFEGKHLGFF